MYIQQGMSGPEVEKIQKKLKSRGFYPGPIDSHFGPRTKEAVTNFQRNNALQIDGIVGPETWKALFKEEAHIFISHSHRDSVVAQEIAAGLENGGYRTWFYQRDCHPGLTHLIQTREAIEQAGAVIIIISHNSIHSNQMTREVVKTFELNKPAIPLLLDISHNEFQKLAPVWEEALVSATSAKIPPEGVTAFMDRLILGLKALGLQPQSFSNPPVIRESPSNEDIHLTDDTPLSEVDLVSPIIGPDEFEVRAKANFKYHMQRTDLGGLSLGQNANGETMLDHSGKYVMASNPTNDLGHLMRDIPLVSEFVLQAQITKFNGPDDQWFGFLFGEQHPANYHEILLNGRGAVRVTKHFHRHWSGLGLTINLGNIHPGNATNTLKVVRKAGTFIIFVNGFNVLSVQDADIRVGQPGMVVGGNLRVGFSEISLAAVEVENLYKLYHQALHHWQNLEMREARQLLKEVASQDPANLQVLDLLELVYPDYRESILIVIGHRISNQLYDGIPAARLQEEINQRGKPHELRFAGIVSDIAVLENKKFHRCPLVSIGGPLANQVTSKLSHLLPDDQASTEHIHI